MKKIKLRDIFPLNNFQQLSLYLIIACVFQFLLFFSPVLAQEAVAREMIVEEDLIEVELEENIFVEMSNELIVSNDELEIEKDQDLNVVRRSVHTITAYNSLPEQTNDQPCITANGFNVCEHGLEDTIAANFLRFGTKVRIPDLFGDRIFIVRDRMNKRYPDRVDVWMLEKSDAIAFGLRRVTIEVLE
jgi:3D (Asp-Asp-Asp) domain-containing protein